VRKCGRIIAAFPHIKKNLAAFDLDWQERAVFDLVRQVQYYSGVINLPNSSKGRFSRLLKLTGEQQRQHKQHYLNWCRGCSIQCVRSISSSSSSSMLLQQLSALLWQPILQITTLFNSRSTSMGSG
jgi:hypothetical protein